MERIMKRILLFSVILFALGTLFISVNAVTIQETTNTNDAYDTIEKGSIIIGTTKFSPNTVITAKKAAIAGANDMKVFVAKGGDITKYTEPAIYYYVATNSWYNVREDGEVEPTENISSLELYYVDNEPKTGIDSVTKEEIKVEPPEEVATHTVTYMNDSEVFATQEVKEGEKTSAPTKVPTKTGYTFKKWLNIDFSKTVTEDIIAVAEWQQNSYSVTFNSNGGSSVSSQNVLYGNKVNRPEDPTRTNYVFEGWYIGETAYDFNKVVSANITLTAKWSLEKYTVTFINDTSIYGDVVTVERGSKVTKPTTNPTKAGHTFVDWYKDGASFDFNSAIMENTIITAEFKAITYNIVIGATTNGTITVPKTSAIYGDNILITITPDAGFVLSSLIVKDASNNNVTVSTDNIFTMPESNVTINAEFVRDSVAIDTRNDLAILTEVNKAMTKISNGEDDKLLEVTYDKSTNTLKMVVNDEKDETLNVVNYMKTQLDLINEVTENIKTITYNSETINVSNLNASKAKIAKVLLQLAEQAIPTDDAAIISAAKALTFADISIKNITITADYEADKEIEYSLILEIKDPTDLRDTKNDETINGLTSSVANDDVYTEMIYTAGTNSATLMVNEDKKKELVIDHADTFVNTILEIANEANSFYYQVGAYTSSIINLTDKSENAAKVQVAKILLKLVTEKTDATKITLEDIIGKTAIVVLQYNNNVELTYTISIDMLSHKEENNDTQITTIANNFTDSEHNALDIAYNSATNKVTLSMDSTNNGIEVMDYYSPIWNVVKTIATDANNISYTVGATNGSETNATTALKKIVKALLAEAGKPQTEEAAEELTFGEIKGKSVSINVDYGNDIVLAYTIDFINN